MNSRMNSIHLIALTIVLWAMAIGALRSQEAGKRKSSYSRVAVRGLRNNHGSNRREVAA